MGSSSSTRKSNNTYTNTTHATYVQICNDCRTYHLYSEHGKLSEYCPLHIKPVNVLANKEVDKNLESHVMRNKYTATAPDEYHYLHSQVNNQLQTNSSYEPLNNLSTSGISNSNYDNLNIKHTTDFHSGICKDCNSYHAGCEKGKLSMYCRLYARSQPNDNKSAGNSNYDNLNIKHTKDFSPGMCKGCNSYHVESEKGKLSTHCPFFTISQQNDNKDTSNVQLEIRKNILFNKEKCISEDQITQAEKKEHAVLPLTTLTKDNFATMWFSWKNEFLTYLKSIDPTENNKEKWGILLLNRLGPIGQEIHRIFIFDNNQAKENFDVLLEKFDQYCAFDNSKRNHDKDIDIYINDLKIMASKYTTNVEEVVKKKVLEEIDMEKFTRKAMDLISEFSVTSNLKSLTLQEVTYIWMKSENVNFIHKEKIDFSGTVRNCSKCDLMHAINNCPAYGKQCHRCNNINHYSNRCPTRFKTNCTYCGDSHFYKECLAYMNKCSKCDRLNHFYWMCENFIGCMKMSKVINCKFCGLTHIASRSKCPAINNICSSCSEKGHFPSKCSERM